jgi:preprotein translocase subunit SecB
MNATINIGKSGFSISHIILIRSNFTRTIDLSFDEALIDNQVQISSTPQYNDSNLILYSIMNFKQVVNGVPQLEAEIEFAGVFTRSEDATLSFDAFAATNAPAILFPYLREHLSGLCLKAGVAPVLVPPLNFTVSNPDENIKPE